MATKARARLGWLVVLANAVALHGCVVEEPAAMTDRPASPGPPRVLPPVTALVTLPAAVVATMPSASDPSVSNGALGQLPSGTTRERDDRDDPYLGLPQPESGFRLSTRGRVIPAQADIELCEVGALPGAADVEYHIGAIETASTDGSHHLIVTTAEPGSEADLRVRARELGDPTECVGAAAELGQQGLTTLAANQTRYAESEYPRGVGLRAHGGQRVMFDYHYFNFTDEPITAKVAIALHTLDPREPIAIASAFSVNNMTIDTPPGTERTFTASCAVERDVMLSEVVRHTHSAGTDFSVWFAGGPRDGQLVWTSTDWEHDLSHRFEEPLLIKAGEGLTYACSFRNDGNEPLRYGIRSSDEMCILVGTIWSPTPGAEVEQEECLITWIDGQGVGHAADDAGGFPKAEPQDATACRAQSAFGWLPFGCYGCVCDSCATILAKCNADSDCKALLDCTSACSGAPDCGKQCEPVTREHSSGLGLLIQASACIHSQCASACGGG